MRYLEEKKSTLSLLIENQFPTFVQENNSRFLKFLESYYESLETQYQPLDIASNLIDYYNVGYYRQNQLVKKTELVGNLLSTDTTITVTSTVGFPKNNGYFQIDEEIIFYREKTSTQFLECVRGTAALVLQSVPKSEVVLTNSTPAEHASGSSVLNIAYTYAIEFFRRIKLEIATLIPEKVSSDLDISSFLKQIKSFYSAKGSLNGHRIIFKILFNDRRTRLYLKPRGNGAKIKINNYIGIIPSDPPPTIISGGSNYDNRIDPVTNRFLNSPIIDIIGSGTGQVNAQGLRPNKTAVVEVSGIDSNGSITSLEVTDTGDGYVGPITAKVRPRSFYQEQKVYSASKTGYGRVDYWDGFTNELVLYDVIGYFRSDDEIISEGEEKARGFISRIFKGTTSIREGIEIIPETQNIEFPRDYAFRTSESNYIKKQIIKLRLLSGQVPPTISNVYTLKQDSDTVFGVPGVDIEIDNFIPLVDNIFEYEISTNSDIDQIYLPASTEVVLGISNITSSYVDENGSTKLTISVDDASKFPIVNGLIYISGNVIEYKTRSHNQFFDCTYNGNNTFSIFSGDKVISWGRKKYDVVWQQNQTISVNDFRFFGENLYKATNSGVTGSTPPTHTSGIKKDGSFALGNQNPVSWRYVSSNLYNYYFYIASQTLDEDAIFEIIALPSNIIIEDGGALHTKQQYEFADFDSPNTKMYNFTSSEISDRLAVVLSSNFNRSYSVVTNKDLPSYKSMIGFNTQYDYEDYIYVPTTTIPKWWNSIVDLSQSLSSSDAKKVSFTNQKVLTRWKKSGLIDDTQAVGTNQPTNKAIGLNIDAIQINSFRGNTVRYGKIDTFTIADGGTYQVPFKSNGFDFDITKLPTLTLTKNGVIETIPATSELIGVSTSIIDVNYTELFELWDSSNLTGFTSKPSVQVINRNPNKKSTVVKSNINTTTNVISVVYQQSELSNVFKTTDRVQYIGAFSLVSPVGQSLTGIIPQLTENEFYYVRNLFGTTTVQYALYKSETDCLLDRNRISLNYLSTVSNFELKFETGLLNPIDFVSADIDLSYNQNTGSIDNFIILNSGKGYVEAPIIRISGGGKLNNSFVDVPYEIDGVKIIDVKGSLISRENFYKTNYFEFANTYTNTIYDSPPTVKIDDGTGAEASVYVANGRIVSVILISQGQNYFTKPIVELYGTGENGVIEAKIDGNGRIIGFDIINPGEGYTQQPRLEIVPSGSNGLISCILKEWTFNLVHRMNLLNRIDNYGGYVYDSDDSNTTVTTQNPLGFSQINSNQNLPPSIDDHQYLLLQPSDKLLAEYTRTQRAGFLKYLYPNRDLTTNPLTDSESLNSQVHSPAISVSYDGIPVYGKRGYSIRWQSNSPIIELKSRFKLKYSTIQTPGSVEKVVNGTSYFLSRDGGPSISQYPIGSFVEDYEFVPGGLNDLDVHNGRFCVTPEFPEGRYCYFSTTNSFDAITNALVDDSNLSFGGFPYFIGPTYASIPDSYPNKACRSSDKLPKNFIRSFEKTIPGFEIPNFFEFPGLPSNPHYPKEYKKYDRTIARSSSVTPGTVDSIIIESSGSNYRVGDKLIIDNTLTSGSGFTGFVSKIKGKSILGVSYNNQNTEVSVTTSSAHGLSIGDYVYFDYQPSTPSLIYLHGYQSNGQFFSVSNKVQQTIDLNLSTDLVNVDKFKDKKFYVINLNSKFTYDFRIPSVDYIFAYDVDATNEHFILPRGSETDRVIIDASLIPSTLYLHIGDYIYQINKTNEYRQEYRVLSVDSQTNTFIFDPKTNTRDYETSSLTYSSKSRGASGGIAEVSISNPGFNYRRLPRIAGIQSENGVDALLQTNSSTIGKIRNVTYLTSGNGFTANQNVNYYLNLPSTTKVINNFEIYDVEIIDGGFEYKDVLVVKVNGSTTAANIKINAQLGTITSVEVIDGGSNFSAIPSITVESTTGYGAILKAKVRRKPLLPGNTIRRDSDPTSLFPVEVTGKVVNFDDGSSTLEFDEYTGQFQENDTIYTSDGRPYGKIVSIRRPRAYAKASSHIQLESSRTDITGNTSEYLQKITDSNIYQDWSYIISSSRDTIEWKDQILSNTHPAGHNLFGKKLIERRKFFFENPEEVFKSSVIFTTNLVNNILLKVKLSPCKQQTISLVNVDDFSVGDYIFGTISGAIGEIVEITEMSLKVNVRNNINFTIGEVITKVAPTFAFGIQSITNKFLGFWEGIMQEPEVSYEVSPFDLEYDILSDVFIPKFDLLDGENIGVYKLTNSYDYLDSVELNSDNNSFSLTFNGTTYPITQSNIGEFIFSIGGSVQNPANLTVSQNIVYLNETVNYNNTRVFGIRQQNLKPLTFTGDAIGTTFALNYTPETKCNLIIFYTGVSQNHEITDWSLDGNTVIFSETVEKDKIFGWYIDEQVECYLFDVDDFIKHRITGTRGCTTKNFTHFIHSSAVKNPTSLYEIKKEVLDGTVVSDSDGTTVYGFDTKFTYTSPKYSKSYVEIMDPLPFNGSTTSFTLKTFDNLIYVPKNGEKSTLVYINNQILDHDSYVISGSTITFNQAYPSTTKCTILDFISGYSSNYTGQNSEILDRLNVVQNGSRKTFNLSNNGVPQYVRNPGDIFVIKNGVLKRPELRSRKNKLDSETESLLNNKFTFVNAPISTDKLNLVYFNRQLLPEPTKNVVLDDFRCYDGVRVEFPLTLDGILFTPINAYHLFVIRNGVYQKPNIDFTVSGVNIIFATAPTSGENVFIYYSYDSLNQNIPIDNFRKFDGVTTSFPLTVNYISTDISSVGNLQVYRNGVYQYPLLDYTVDGNVNARYITFTTPPIPDDDIFITNYNTTDFVDITSRFAQHNSTILQYNPQNPIVDTEVFLIYINGILQIGDSWSFDSLTNRLLFNDSVSLSSDKVTIFAFQSAKRSLDSFVIQTGVSVYDLNKSGVKITTDLPTSEASLVVSIDGVVQKPGVSYNVFGDTIELLNLNKNIGSTVYIYQTGNSTELLDYLNDNYSKSTYKLTTNFASFNPPNSDDILILRNGVIQNPTEDYITGNGFITFTDNINEFDDLFIMYTHGTQELPVTSASGSIIELTSAPNSSNYENIIVFVNGVPKFLNKDFTISGSTITLIDEYIIDSNTTPFVIEYPPVIYIDDPNDCPNGSRTRFKLLYNVTNLIISDIVSDADILVSVNGIVQYPGVQYTISANRALIDFLMPPQHTDEIFFVRMSGNEVIDLTATGNPRRYDLSQPITSEQENLVVFSNNEWKFTETGSYSYVNNNTVQLAVANTSQYVFGIKFTGTFGLLDEIHTPYNSSNTKFNLFINQENFVPIGTIQNDNIPDETGLFVIKNGKVLDPKVDYQLSGDIKSQILFTTAPASSDVISVKSFGAFNKINSITSGLSGKVFAMTYTDNNISKSYYPNSEIARPREHENQILVLRDGNIQSPIYDYYIDNNKIIFNNNIPTTSKLVILDFRGTVDDVSVNNRFGQIKPGDQITITGENTPRTVTEVLSPTVLKTQTYSGLSPEGFAGTVVYSSGKVTDIVVNNGGVRYEHPVVLRTKGSGTGAKATAGVNQYEGGKIKNDTIEVQFPGYNVYAPQEVVATGYAFTYRQQQLSKSQIRKATKLSANINATDTTILLANTTGLPSNPPSITATALTGSGASFRAYVSDGKIVKVDILTIGIGYDDRSIEFEVSGGGGTGCVLEPVLDAFGRFTDVIIRNQGSGYDTFKVIVYDPSDTTVDAEFIEYTYVTSTGITGCTRGSGAESYPQNTLVYFDNYL
jgi:hypothetical protein